MKWSRFNTLFYSKKIGYGIFNSRMLSFSELDENSYNNLVRIKNDNNLIGLLLADDSINDLKNKKIIVQDNEDNDYVNMLRYRKRYMSFTSKRLSLVVCPTLFCNFACPYCYEKDLPNRVMNDETMKDLIAFINRNSEGKESLALNWHGGEPLSAFQTIKKIYGAIETHSQLPIGNSTMVSNGSLLTAAFASFWPRREGIGRG